MKNAKIEEKTFEKTEEKKGFISCNDKSCPFHGNISLRGRIFRGYVKKKFENRVVLEFERVIYIIKYERYMKKKTKLHAHLPKCLSEKINLNDYVEVKECRPLSKIIHFIVTKKIQSKHQEEISIK